MSLIKDKLEVDYIVINVIMNVSLSIKLEEIEKKRIQEKHGEHNAEHSLSDKICTHGIMLTCQQNLKSVKLSSLRI